MALGKFWFIDPKGQQQEGDGMDAVMAAVARGELLPDSNFYDASLNAWKKASEVPALAGTLGGQGASPPPPPPPPPPRPLMPPPPVMVPDAFHPPVLQPPSSPIFKPLTFAFMLGAAVLGGMTNRTASGSFPIVIGGALLGVVIMMALIGAVVFGIAFVIKSRPRRPWLVWMNIALFMLLAMVYQMVKGPTSDFSPNQPAVQNGPAQQSGGPNQGRGFVPNE